jgi:eukaryotic-like serine/threonine-protein kinase
VSNQTIAHYNLLERLGTGALGDVYRARDLKVGRTVALMALPPELIADASRREQFLKDARAAAALNHPNIATLFDVIDQDGRCYLAYEFAAGPSLREEMDGRAVNMRRAIELAAQVADALAEGHSRGLIHGDLRPDNIVVTPKGSPKILNFGLARWTTGGRARKAAASADGLADDPITVAAYLSPEQALGGTIDERSDVFSFGTVLYEMLTGRCPFIGDSPAATVMNVIRVTPPPPSRVNSAISPDLDALILRAMAKPVESRPAGALAVSSDLRRIAVAVDAREGNAPKAELIPMAPPASGKGRKVLMITAVVLLVALVLWFI